MNSNTNLQEERCILTQSRLVRTLTVLKNAEIATVSAVSLQKNWQ